MTPVQCPDSHRERKVVRSLAWFEHEVLHRAVAHGETPCIHEIAGAGDGLCDGPWGPIDRQHPASRPNPSGDLPRGGARAAADLDDPHALRQRQGVDDLTKAGGECGHRQTVGLQCSDGRWISPASVGSKPQASR